MPGELGSSDGAALADPASTEAASDATPAGAATGSDLQLARLSTATLIAPDKINFFTKYPPCCSPVARDTGSGEPQRPQNSHKFWAMFNRIEQRIIPQLG